MTAWYTICRSHGKEILQMIASYETKSVVKNILTEVMPHLDEKQKRLLLGSAAKALGHGGIAFVNEVTGSARNTITSGISQICEAESEGSLASGGPADRIRKPGAGRKSALQKNPMLYDKIEEIITQNGDTYGNPEKPLRWTTWSLRKIAQELVQYGINVSQHIVSRALDALGYSKQQNQKMYQIGEQHPDRDAQFRYINDTSAEFLTAGEPVISIDTKKKENIGNFKNGGSEYRPVGDPRKVLDHDFPLPELGKVSPYGVYVLNNNTGFVNLGTSHDTPEFAGESIAQWWRCVGKHTFPDAKRLYITCDSGGSNGCRIWLWKHYVQELANETGMDIHVSHYPTGTSKWNKVEHRLFCYISKNWQGKPLINIETVVNLIGSTTTEKGLSVICRVDDRNYETGKKITAEQKEALNIEFVGPNEKWNYIIRPNDSLNL